MEELAPYLRAWRTYFGFCETPLVLISLTRWVRLRLLAAVENTSPSTGCFISTGGSSATGKQYRRQRPWPLVSRSGQSSLRGAFQAYFKSLGLPTLIDGF
jgi:RNA-directed DNA polymerase